MKIISCGCEFHTFPLQDMLCRLPAPWTRKPPCGWCWWRRSWCHTCRAHPLAGSIDAWISASSASWSSTSSSSCDAGEVCAADSLAFADNDSAADEVCYHPGNDWAWWAWSSKAYTLTGQTSTTLAVAVVSEVKDHPVYCPTAFLREHLSNTSEF